MGIEQNHNYLMGKLFDALCFSLVLLAATPHFTRGGCCKRGGKECGSVMECVEDKMLTAHACLIYITSSTCDFGVPSAGFQSDSTFHVRGKGGLRRLSFHGNISVPLKRIEFVNVRFTSNGRSTVNLFDATYASFYNSVFTPGVNMVFKGRDVWVVVQKTHFNLDAKGPTMLEVEKGYIELSGDDNIVRCTKGCNQTTIKVGNCGYSILKDVLLSKSGTSVLPIIEFFPCSIVTDHLVFQLVIERTSFHGRVPTKDSAWIQVQGDESTGPTLDLMDNNYGGLAKKAQTQIGTVFKFIGSVPLHRSDVESKFYLKRNSSRVSPSGWSNEDHLATLMCYGKTHKKTLPIGPTKQEERYILSCPPLCCYVEDKSGKQSFDASIAGCAKGQDEIVHVIRDCPLGEPGSRFHVGKIQKADSVKEKLVAITLEGSYQFGETDDGQLPIVFENIHFKKATGAGDRAAKIHLGRENPTGVDAPVQMIGCLVDEGIVVEMGHDVHFTATETTFFQGSTESVVHFLGDTNQVVKLSGCILAETECHTMITGSLCGKFTIEETELSKESNADACAGALVDLEICNRDVVEAPSLKIEGITFDGELDGEGDAAWIKVQGSFGKGPHVTLLNNDYSGLEENTSVYRFTDYIGGIRLPAFKVSRQVTDSDIDIDWDADQMLATVVHVENDGTIYFSESIFPIGDGGLIKKTHVLGELCCYARHTGGAYFNGRSIAECLKLGNHRRTEVVLTYRCPLGDMSGRENLDLNAVFEKDRYADDIDRQKMAITLAEGQERHDSIPSDLWEIRIESSSSSPANIRRFLR
eukprot:TRINITY_DN2237_c0_g1_i2.p1 TRINITY_DN2237_c0_g1~~TRINITY_DN2237_c0_g1_i2.p1  ORF type:complete len:809 (+),score=67.31 TRINITY_DN2237_c0_g1_i2:74-2500(+)